MFFFFFKQKTAYEIYQCDWSSDVCSYDLALGPVGMVRFIQSFELGSGDYTRERSRWLDQSTEEIVAEIRKMRAKKTEPSVTHG